MLRAVLSPLAQPARQKWLVCGFRGLSFILGPAAWDYSSVLAADSRVTFALGNERPVERNERATALVVEATS